MITTAPGVFDIYPNNDEKNKWKDSFLWNYVEEIVRETAFDFGYKEIRTPLFERTELFKSVGEDSDIVTKEMYTFQDKGNRSMTLRPEGTAPVIRSFIENKLHINSPVQKFFYIGPMFRYERQQAGRYRQHHQFGAEAIGNGSPMQDVESIDLLYTLYERLGIKNLTLHVNSIGNHESRNRFRIALKEYYKEFYQQLSEDSKIRLEKNPLRILDSKDPKDIKINEGAPSILNFLDDECKRHFEEVKKLLTNLKIPFTINDKLVRGLDYYNKTVFEITAGELGAQNSIGGGGRYDGLIKNLNGPDLPSCGFGTGLERIIQTMIGQNIGFQGNKSPLLFIIPLGDEAKIPSFSLLHELRQKEIFAEMDLSGKKLNKVMQYANELGAHYVTVIGENELKTGLIDLKEMKTGHSIKIRLEALCPILQIEARTENFIKNWKELSQPFENESEAEFFKKKLDILFSDTNESSEELLKSLKLLQGLLAL